MARIRYLKPGFFDNEALAEQKPLARLLFAGLWCYADREGRLEDRPARLKKDILGYDNCNVGAMLDDLAAAGFIIRFQDDTGQRLIQVVNFSKHQRPHKKELPSAYPAPAGYSPSTNLNPADEDTSTNPNPHEPAYGMENGERESGMGDGQRSTLTEPPAAGAAPPPSGGAEREISTCLSLIRGKTCVERGAIGERRCDECIRQEDLVPA